MFNHRTLLAALGVLAIGGVATPAMAGQCPAGKQGNNALANRVTAPKDVTDTVIGSIDLANEVGLKGYDLRVRRLIVQPGGAVPFHSHDGRPALIITVKGEITEYRTDCTVGVVHKAGEISRETRGLAHYWVNRGKQPVELLSADVNVQK
jgi:quercetin dioxygenase-like cupin family protein